ncbi:MAG: hypothetical protein J0L75_04245 [Spirochaetes bacterium]|nr:hypothetical protein [Spirochaetota bacterium]
MTDPARTLAAVKRESLRIFDVEYEHLLLEDGSELFLTAEGRKHEAHLHPEDLWGDAEWIARRAVRLSGTSSVYRIRLQEGLEVVLKWNRMGQEIPGETHLMEGAENVVFNSPFEEFSLVQELERSVTGPDAPRIQRPMAIYIHKSPSQPWELGRDLTKIRKHEDIDLQLDKSYAVVYRWIHGSDVLQAFQGGALDQARMNEETAAMDQRLAEAGYFVADRKPQHIILVDPRLEGEGPARGLVDFELLKRTADHAARRNRQRREAYLWRQVHRFDVRGGGLSPNLHQVEILGVPYVWGNLEGSGSDLWVVGRDPGLFDYFRPEKWRKTDKVKLSAGGQTFFTTTKDDIKLVWKTSRVGEMPHLDFDTHREAVTFGFNSPFEEVAIALHFAKAGVPVVYPRAIFRSDNRTRIHELLFDPSRYESHQDFVMPDGKPALRRDHSYITLWGYWNGTDNELSVSDAHHLYPINANLAFKYHHITDAERHDLMASEQERLCKAGYEDLNRKGSHLLLSLDEKKKILRDGEGRIALRYCNLGLVRGGSGEKKLISASA